jgi:hypothetical protein
MMQRLTSPFPHLGQALARSARIAIGLNKAGAAPADTAERLGYSLLLLEPTL